MLTKCMLTPLKLARLVEWNGRLGKPSAIMAIDVTNHQVGIALAYHRQQTSPDQTSDENNDGQENNGSGCTSITALPPIPYMSRDPYHPSYAFLHHHRFEDNAMRKIDRVERTVEVADQLAQLAHDRKVKGILVRWPGDLASTISGGNDKTEESIRVVEESPLLFPMDASSDRNHMGAIGGGRNSKSDGSQGYMRGRILYLLDKCCTSHGHDQEHVPSEPLLMEGSRPFALWDTSRNEQNWITYHQQNNRHIKHAQPLIPKEQDKFGNSLMEMDLWGRAAIFGNQPPEPIHGKFYYSSKQKFVGYRVSNQFGVEGDSSTDDGRGGARTSQMRNENFDSLHDNESRRMSQFEGSLSAMHALYDFAVENLQGRITLPLWASRSNHSAPTNRSSREQSFDDGLFNDRLHDEEVLGYRAKIDRVEDTSKLFVSSPAPNKTTISGTDEDSNIDKTNKHHHPALSKKPNGLATLVKMPTRKRRRGKRES